MKLIIIALLFASCTRCLECVVQTPDRAFIVEVEQAPETGWQQIDGEWVEVLKVDCVRK